MNNQTIETQTTKSQTQILAEYLIEQWGDHGPRDESAVEMAIRLLEEFRQQGS